MLVELVYDQMAYTALNYMLLPILITLSDIYSTYPPCFVMYYKDLSSIHPEGKKARGGYTLSSAADKPAFGVILLDSTVDEFEIVPVLIHEYAHHLSQQNHGFTMFELWKEHLTQEYERRGQYVIREGDTEDYRRRHVVVRKVRFPEKSKHISESCPRGGPKNPPDECPV